MAANTHTTHHLYDDHVRTEISRGRAETFAAVARGIMFILLGFAAMAFSTPTKAEQLGYVLNQAGGRIYLTDSPATTKDCENTLIAYATSSSGGMMFGCWILDGDIVMVRWTDGDVSAFQVSDFLMPDHKLEATTTGTDYLL